MLRVSVSVLLLLGAISALAQDVYYTLGEALSRVENTSEYLQEMRETSIKQLTHKTFHSQVLPQISLHASVPSYEKSISMVSQNDGSYVYRSRTYANSELSLGIRQLVPFTGGWLTFKSSLSRLDNLNNTAKTYAYYYNIGKISYKQTIGGYNEYKWLKRKDEADKVLENIQHRQNIEKIKFKVVDAFFSLLCAQKRIELTQQNYELAKLVYNRAESLYQQNRISKANLIEVEVDLLKEKNAIQNRKALQDAQNNLTLLLNDSSNLIVAFSEKDFPSFFQSFDKEKILEKVLRYNVDLVEKSENLSQQMIVQKQKSTMRPSVEIEVGGGVNSQFKNFTDAYKDKLESNLISLSISMPLYDGKISSYKLKMEKLRMELLNDKYRVSKDRYIQSMMSELSKIISIMRSFILLLVCLFSLHLDAQTEFRVYQKDTEKSRYYMSASINGTKLNDILITSSASGFYIKEHDFNKLFTNHSFTKSKLKVHFVKCFSKDYLVKDILVGKFNVGDICFVGNIFVLENSYPFNAELTVQNLFNISDSTKNVININFTKQKLAFVDMNALDTTKLSKFDITSVYPSLTMKVPMNIRQDGKVWNLKGNLRLDLGSVELIEFYPSKYLDEFCRQTKVKLIDVYNDYLDSYKAIRYDKLKIGTKYFPNHFIPIMKNISIKNSFGSINGSFFKGNFYIDLKKNKLYYE